MQIFRNYFHDVDQILTKIKILAHTRINRHRPELISSMPGVEVQDCGQNEKSSARKLSCVEDQVVFGIATCVHLYEQWDSEKQKD